MKLRILVLAAFLVLASAATVYAVNKEFTPDWSMNATIIEACSCPMFCQCYFDHKPASHAEHASMNGMSHGDAGTF